MKKTKLNSLSIKKRPICDVFFIILLGFITYIILSNFLYIFHAFTNDESILVESAYRIAGFNETIYRDFHTHFSLLPVYYLVLFFKIFGINVTALKLATFFQFYLLSVLFYLIGKKLTGCVSGFLISLLFLTFTMPSWPVLSHQWISVIVVFLSFLCFLKYLETEKTFFSVICSVISALSAVTLQNAFISLFIFYLIIIIYFVFKKKYSFPMNFTAGYFVSLMIISFFLFINGNFFHFINDNYLIAFNQYEIYKTNTLSSLITTIRNFVSIIASNKNIDFTEIITLMATIRGFISLVITVVSLLISLYFLIIKRNDITESQLWFFILFIFYAVPLLSYAFTATYSNFFAGFTFCALLIFYRYTAKNLKPLFKKVFLIISVIFFIWLSSFSVASTMYVKRFFIYPVKFTTNTYYFMNPDIAREQNQLVNIINKNTKIYDPVFFPPNMISYMAFFTHRKNSSQIFELGVFHKTDTITGLYSEILKEQPDLVILPAFSVNGTDKTALYYLKEPYYFIYAKTLNFVIFKSNKK